MKQMALDIGLALAPSLRNFIPGPNLEALRHLQVWASAGSGVAARSPVPTYLWGAEGSGKTHLLLGVAQALKEQGCTVGYLSSQDQEPPAFDERWSAVLLDDVHLYTAVQQHAAFAWFVQAQSQQAGVVAAGELPPADLKLREDLRTRLGWGHVWALQLMGDDERRAVLISAAQERGLSLSPEVVDFILTRFSRDLGHLMQLLHHLDAYALQVQRTITIPLIRDMLQDS